MKAGSTFLITIGGKSTISDVPDSSPDFILMQMVFDFSSVQK
jgi:hypothetical protein